MNPDVKAQWVAALRSGEYQQGKGQLRFGDRFCCLGVLCDLAVKAGADVTEETDDDCHIYNGAEALPPMAVSLWSGLQGLRVEVEGETASLDALNDGWRGRAPWTFDQIADVIEAQL